MRTSTTTHGAALLLAACLGSTTVVAQLISDFDTTRPMTILTGDLSWSGDVQTFGGAQLVGVNGSALQSGGAAATFGALDLSSSSALQLTAARILGNSLGTWQVRLQSSDAGVTAFSFSPTSFPEGSYGAVSIPFSSGTVIAGAGVDLTSVVAFGIQGDGSGSLFAGAFNELAAVPEPQLYALIFGLGLVGFAAYRRHSKQAA